MQQLSRQASHVHRMGLGDGDSNSSRQTGPQTSVERVRRNQEARRKARRNAQWKDDSRNQGGANGNTSNADGRRKTEDGRGILTETGAAEAAPEAPDAVRDITSAVGGEEGKLDRSNEAAEEEHLGVKVKVRANEGG
ncbi:hypothetical protein E4U24_003699 [Claviceps purpurea]|nr:hypothetical protein E4U24_003699 [Claviceps purpurea]KAG6317596.1 hypothetical protein E4U44_008582 [Claviceps purpurea]